MKYVLRKSIEDLFGKRVSDAQAIMFFSLFFAVSALSFILPAFF
jgi:hypothetical protein